MGDKKILITGDSFAVNLSTINNCWQGWSYLLTKEFDVTNLAQCGIGEYKILKQIESADLDRFDYIIVSHTSPNRVHIQQHPIHLHSLTYRDADLIFNDVSWHLKSHPEHPVLRAAQEYFVNIYDQEYQDRMYRLLQEKIVELIANRRSLHLLTLDNKNQNIFPECLDLHQLFEISPGNDNHYSNIVNKKIYDLIKKWIEHG